MSQSTAANPPHPHRLPVDRSWSQWWVSVRLPACVFSIFAMLIGGITYFNYTLVSGTELNSVSWELRDFSFRRDPFTNWQLTGIRYQNKSLPSAWVNKDDAVRVPDPAIKKYLTAKLLPPPRWDLVELQDGVLTVGKAKILVDLVESNGFNSTSFWITWSRNEPNKATEFWPAAQQLVADKRYSRLPDLFEMAVYADDDAMFKAAISELLDSESVQE